CDCLRELPPEIVRPFGRRPGADAHVKEWSLSCGRKGRLEVRLGEKPETSELPVGTDLCRHEAVLLEARRELKRRANIERDGVIGPALRERKRDPPPKKAHGRLDLDSQAKAWSSTHWRQNRERVRRVTGSGRRRIHGPIAG